MIQSSYKDLHFIYNRQFMEALSECNRLKWECDLQAYYEDNAIQAIKGVSGGVAGAVSNATQGVKGEIRKLAKGDIATTIGNVIKQLIKLMQTAITHFINGEKKLTKTFKEIDTVFNQDNRVFNMKLQDGNKTIKTITYDTLAQVGIVFPNTATGNKNATYDNSRNYTYCFFFGDFVANGSEREKLNWNGDENIKNSVLESVKLGKAALERNAKVIPATKKTFDKWVNYNVDPNDTEGADNYGLFVKEAFGFGYDTSVKDSKVTSNTIKNFFTAPQVQKVNVNQGLYNFLREILSKYREEGQKLLNLKASTYLNKEIKMLQKAERDINSSHAGKANGGYRNDRENKSNDNSSNGTSTGQKPSGTATNVDATNPTGNGSGANDSYEASGLSFNLFKNSTFSLSENMELLEAIKAYGEEDQQNTFAPDTDGKSPEATEVADKTATPAFVYARQFFLNYMTAIQNTLNMYNNFLIFLNNCCRKSLNDFYAITYNGQSQERAEKVREVVADNVKSVTGNKR